MSIKTKISALVIASAALIGATSAQASYFLNDTQTWTTAGQSYEFNFNVTPTTGFKGWLTLHMLGDFASGHPYEDLDWTIEGLGLRLEYATDAAIRQSQKSQKVVDFAS